MRTLKRCDERNWRNRRGKRKLQVCLECSKALYDDAREEATRHETPPISDPVKLVQ